nr:hypothetical protein [Gracilaria tikvahiae]
MVSTNAISHKLNGQLNIIEVKVAPYIRTKLYYSRQNSTDVYILDLSFSVLSSRYKKNLFLGDLIQDICDCIISPFLSLQNSDITWNYISLIYPKHKSNENILNIPIRGLHGQVLNEDNSQLTNIPGNLKFSMRYKGATVASSKRLMGVGSYYLDPVSYNHEACLDVIDQCEKVFYKPIEFPRSQISLHFVQQKMIDKNKSNSKKLKGKNQSIATRKQKIYKKPILVTALPE